MAFNISVTDAGAELDGIWIPYPLVDGIEVKIARFGNKNHEKSLKRLRKPFTAYNKEPSDEQAERITLESLVDAVLLDWRGIKDGDSDVEYSKDVAMQILADPSARDFLDFIVKASTDINTFRKERIAEAGKP